MPSFELLWVGDDSGVPDALADAGLDVRPVSDAAGAMEALPGVDCVVTADDLPHGDGLDLCDRVRARWPDLPVVLYAEGGDASVASAAFAAGAADYVLREEVPPADLPARLSATVERTGRQYHSLIETMGDILYVVDDAGYFEFLNAASESTTGYARQELIGEHVSRVIGPEDVERGQEAIEALLRADEPGTSTVEMTLHTRSGERIPVENHVALLPMPDGEFRGTLGVLRDVSERERRDRRLRDLHDATRELMTATTTEETAELTARAAADVLGYPINSVRLHRDDALEPVAVPDRTRELLGERPTYPVDGDSGPARAFRTADPIVVESLDDADRGELAQLSAGMYLRLGNHGTLSIGTLDAGGFDDTDRKLAAILAASVTATLDRVHQRAELEASHDRLTALFQNIPDPTIYVEFEAYVPLVRDVNPAFERVFGLSASTVEGECVDDYIVPAGQESEADEYNQLIQSGESFHGEVRRHAADGLRDFLLHVVPYAVGERSTRGFAIYTDITDHKERERQLERQNERLEQFASVVSHDLRNPLNVAQGRLGLAREERDPADFDAIERALDRMEGLIQGLLDLARQGQALGETEPVDLAELARLAWSGVETNGSELVVENPPRVEGDPERLRQLFENLFRNSVEHGSTGSRPQADDSVEHGSTSSQRGSRADDSVEHGSTGNRPQADDSVEHGGADVTVTVGAHEDGFYVADDGPGIPEADREAVFEFGHSGSGGTGFGLAIVREIADAHGWSIAIADGPGSGATFAVTGVASVSSS